MKKLLSALLVFFFLQTQSYARANQSSLNDAFMQMANEIAQGKMNSEQIVSKAKELVREAKAAGVTEEQFVSQLSEKMALNMSAEDVRKTVDELKANPSLVKVQEIAQSLEKVQNGDKVLMVLLTFALLSALWIGIFFLLTDPFFPL